MRFETSKYRETDLVDVPERGLVQYIINEASTLYSFFNFVVEPAIGSPHDRQRWDYLLFAEAPRFELGLGPGQPGDIDVLIIPVFDKIPRAEFSAGIEVKRLALRGPNWLKNVDRYGVSQAEGLLRAGLPFVGILHLIVNRPGPPDNWKNLTKARVIDDQGRIELMGESRVDMTGYLSAERQFARLLSRNPSEAIGLNCIALSQIQDDDGKHVWFSTTEPAIRHAKRNPRTHPMMVRNLQSLAEWAQSKASPRVADQRRQAAKNAGGVW